MTNTAKGTLSQRGQSKPYAEKTRRSSVSARRAAGGKANKKHKFVGSFGSDRKKAS